ncbi:MAG: Sensor protein kinase walK [Pseudomonadota bacterium]|jgi:nitrogen fixation/metabolism regulation signal transduction histidine kinase
MEKVSGQYPDEDKRAVGRLLRFALISAVACAVVLLVLLAGASASTGVLEHYYPSLLWVTSAVALALLTLVAELMRRLVNRYRRRLFGSRLMARLALSFILMTVIPVALIYLVSFQFIGRSVESWFAVPVERALDSGLSLGRASLDTQQGDLLQKARAIAIALADTAPAAWASRLDRLREQIDVQEALVVTGGRTLVVAVGARLNLIPDLPSPAVLRQVRQVRSFTAVETVDPSPDGTPRRMQLRVIVPLPASGLTLEEGAFLQLISVLPQALAEHLEAVEQGRRDVQALSLSREGLNQIFTVTLTLIFLLTVFAAIASAFLLAGWLTGPLAMLAAGTRAVAEGDFRPVKAYSGRDELGVLTQSFNRMTRQLEEARDLVDRNRLALEEARARLSSIVSNLTAGVIVLDARWDLVLANPGAMAILRLPFERPLPAPIASIPRLAGLASDIRQAFNELEASGAANWQRQFVLPPEPVIGERQPGWDADQTILARGSILPGQGYVVVFDDLTEVLSAQRSVAWAEVARRLAHEIKNPLTPIQLSAERLVMRLAAKLPQSEADLLTKSVRTIVDQVAALKHLVDEFRDYARLPSAHLRPLELNTLVDDVLRLYANNERRVALQIRLAEGLPPLMGDAPQLRQVIHNLVRNALEATERTADPHILLTTESMALPDGRRAVRLMVRDNGGGFAPSMLARAFEPYVTTKARGTGLGLAIVRKIIDEHGARIEVGNIQGPDSSVTGAQIALLFTKIAKTGDNSAPVAP